MKKVLLIDLMNMFVRNFSALRLTNDNGEHVGGAFGTLNSLQSQIKKHNPDIVSVVWEGKDSSERRRRMLKEYKEGRKFRGLNRHFQLIDERTAIFRPVKTKENPNGELVDLDWMIKKEGVFPPNYALLKAIVGDKSDNIKGVFGVGESTGRRDFPLLSTSSNLDMDDLLEYVGKQKDKKYQKYIDNKELLRKNYEIVQLLDINVNIQSIQAMERSYEKKELKFNSYQLRLKLLNEDISPNNIDNWVSSFMSVQREPLTF
jgi:5'-3' exonuclease